MQSRRCARPGHGHDVARRVVHLGSAQGARANAPQAGGVARHEQQAQHHGQREGQQVEQAGQEVKGQGGGGHVQEAACGEEE